MPHILGEKPAWQPGDECSPAIQEAICAEIASGMSLLALSKREGWPCRAIVYRWLNDYPEFEAGYSRALRVRTYADLDECERFATGEWRFDGAEDEDTGAKIKHDPLRETKEWVARDRLLWDARRWRMARMYPQKFGNVKADAEPPQEPETKVIECYPDPEPSMPPEMTD